MRLPLILLLTSLLCTPALAADDAPAAPIDKSQYNLFNPVPNDHLRDMDTDRPDKTDSPLTLDPGHFQLETGLVDYAYLRVHTADTNARADAWAFGTFDLRVGLTSNLEVDFGTTAFNLLRTQDVTTAQTEHDQSVGDSPLAFKLNLWGNDAEEKTFSTAFGIIAQVLFPTASQPIGSRRAEYSLGFPFGISLPADFSLSLEPSVQCERTAGNTAYTAAFSNGISLSHALLPNLDGFIEYYLHAAPSEKTENTLDLGVVYKLSPNWTLDAAVFVGLNDAAPRAEFTLGTSFRF